MGNKSSQKHRKPQLSVEQIRERATRAQQEGRFQQSLELARTLFKQDPSAENLQFCQQASLGRARQLKAQGSLKDALTVLGNCADMGGDQAFLEQVAEEMAACGDGARAQKILERFPGSAAAAKVLAHAVDSAMRQGVPGRTQLNEALRPQFDIIVQALAEAEAGRDEAARTLLQGIGLNSPFLEWKLFVRGLVAYYQRDDARAIENWQRLEAGRLAAKLAAPLRFLLDPPFRQAQAPEVYNRLQRVADRLQTSGLVASLRRLQSALSNDGSLAHAFQLAESIVLVLKEQTPELMPRLANCFYWAIVRHGESRDLDRYLRLFGKPADDPNLQRLQGLTLEQCHQWSEANLAWKEYDQDLLKSPHWQEAHKPAARALLWKRMGDNAAHHEDYVEDDEEDDEFDDFPYGPELDEAQPAPPDSAEACLRRSIELNPKNLEAHQALAGHLFATNRLPEAEQAGRDLLVHFPRHVDSMSIVAGLCHARQDYAEALRFFEMAMQVNPLDRTLRNKASAAHLFAARGCMDSADYECARGHFRACLELNSTQTSSVYCKWAACEFKAKDAPRAEELLRQAQDTSPDPAGYALMMVIEAIRANLAMGLKKRFGEEWTAVMAGPPAPASATSMIECLAVHQLAGIRYAGQQTHKKKVLEYFQKVPADQFDQDQAAAVCEHLLILKAVKQVKPLIMRARKRFPKHPGFVLLELKLNLETNRASFDLREMGLLRQARTLAEAWPDDKGREAYLTVIKEYEDALAESSPLLSHMAGAFQNMMGGMMDDFMEDEDDE